MTLPREFQSRIASHNRHAIAASAFCLLGAWLSWMLAYALVVGLTLGFLTAIHVTQAGEEAPPLAWPWWVHPAALAGAALLLAWGAVDQRCRRFRPVNDRQIIGWHILGDVLLTPARLTFGVWEHLRAMIWLNETQRYEAFELLRHIREERQCSLSSLGSFFTDSTCLPKLLDALQLAGWIGLLLHDGEWCYIIPSVEEAAVADLMHDENEAGDASENEEDGSRLT